MKALSINKLTYQYRHDWTARRHKALESVSLDVNIGESFGFLGHNGAGKTTTIKSVLGLIKPTSGTISAFGLPSHSVEARRLVGYLPEQPYFYDYLTVKEAMTLYATLAGVPKSTRSDAIKRALDQVKLTDKISSSMRSLSKGLTQRVAMAQAIVAEPKLLILDEPFSGLDPLGRMEFRDLLLELKQKGTTIFMSSHILSDVEFLCDRCSIMVAGSLKGVFDLHELSRTRAGTYELVVRNSETVEKELTRISDRSVNQGKFLNLSFDDERRARKALEIALDAKATVESYHFAHRKLEDIFLEVVRSEQRSE